MRAETAQNRSVPPGQVDLGSVLQKRRRARAPCPEHRQAEATLHAGMPQQAGPSLRLPSAHGTPFCSRCPYHADVSVIFRSELRSGASSARVIDLDITLDDPRLISFAATGQPEPDRLVAVLLPPRFVGGAHPTARLGGDEA